MADFSNGVEFILPGVPVEYAMVQEDRPDEYRGEKKWKIDCMLDDDRANKLKKAKFLIKYRLDENGRASGAPFLSVYRKCITQKGKELDPPSVTLEDGTLYTDAIGNGSICDVYVYARENTDGSGRVVSFLNKVIIKELIPYEGNDAQGIDDILQSNS